MATISRICDITFFNKNEKVKRLSSYLYETNLVIDNKEIVYLYVFQSKNYQELKLNNVISDLLQLAYSFLQQKQLKNHEIHAQATLMEELVERNLSNLLPRIIKKAELIKASTTTSSYLDFLDQSYYYEQLDRLALIQNQRIYDDNLQKMGDTFDVYFLCNKFRIACEMVSRSALLNEQYIPHFIVPCLVQYEQHSDLYQNYPALSVYYHAYRFLKESTTHWYLLLKSLLQLHQNLLYMPEQKHLYTYLLNFCVRQVNFGKSEYYQEIFEIYQVLIKQNLLLQHGYLTKWSFINATTAGIRLNELSWTENFIHQYKCFLKEEEEQNTVDYQLAVLYFAKRDFAKTLQILQQVEFTDVFYQASARIIQLKVFYELDETEAFYALVKSILNLLRRKQKINEYHRLSYINFVQLAKLMFDLKLKPRYQISKKQNKIAIQLETLEPLTNKEWLLEKYNDLKKK
ncbi:MAG: hypothetical protein HC892_18725 [Saprospiraceae bacterium]|nr:hypothetical protein [Saprospiraceae bacterium]